MKQKENSDINSNSNFKDARVYNLYKQLLSEYGPQNWWPADTDYEIIVGAILTQNTAWSNVEMAINNLKKEKVLSPKRIMSIPLEKLKLLIKPAGFYNQKAERLKRTTNAFLKIEKKVNEMSTNELRNYFLSLNGIGKETADSILLYVFNKPVFIIDTYTRRFCKKELNIMFKEYNKYQIYMKNSIPKSVDIYKEYHALIVEWGKRNKR